MKRDKFIKVYDTTYVETATGGSTETTALFWSGWANVTEKGYSTGSESGQWTGIKGTSFIIVKNPVSALITTAMKLEYRGKTYVIGAVYELNPFTLSVLATEKERAS